MNVQQERGIATTFEKVPMGGVYWNGGFYIKSFCPITGAERGVNLESGTMAKPSHDMPVTYMPHAAMNPYGVTSK